MLKRGVCRWCGCVLERACPGGCAWADSSETLCTSCVTVDRAWAQIERRAKNQRRAFFRGFTAASHDPRAVDLPTTCPYGGQTWPTSKRYWQLGAEAGTLLRRLRQRGA